MIGKVRTHQSLSKLVTGRRDDLNRPLNLLSHGAYAIHDPTEMGEDNKDLVCRILRDFIARFAFALPGVVPAQPAARQEAAVQ